MSYVDGWAAINLEMPKRVPRTEFSAAEYHWELVRVVTGMDVGVKSPIDVQQKATQAFIRAWNYDFYLQLLIGPDEFGAVRTNMGHAVYAVEGIDFDDNIQCPFTKPEEVLAFDPWEVYGKRDRKEITHRFNKHCKELHEKYPDLVSATGIYITLITGLIYIFGWEMLLTAIGIDPERFGDMVNRYASWIQQYYDALAESDASVIWSHDDMVWSNGPIFHPDWYRTYVFPNYKKFWRPLIENGKKILYVCDGDYTQFVDDIADCGAHGFWFEIFTDLKYIAENYGQTHFMMGNADTRILLSGTKEQIRAEVERCLNIGKKCPGYFMSVTNHIPPNIPVKNALYYNQVYEELNRR